MKKRKELFICNAYIFFGKKWKRNGKTEWFSYYKLLYMLRATDRNSVVFD